MSSRMVSWRSKSNTHSKDRHCGQRCRETIQS